MRESCVWHIRNTHDNESLSPSFLFPEWDESPSCFKPQNISRVITMAARSHRNSRLAIFKSYLSNIPFSIKPLFLLPFSLHYDQPEGKKKRGSELTMRGMFRVWTRSVSSPAEASRLKKNVLVGWYETVPFGCHVRFTFSHLSLFQFSSSNNKKKKRLEMGSSVWK